MKKLLSVLLACVLTFTLSVFASCTDEKPTSESDNNTEREKDSSSKESKDTDSESSSESDDPNKKPSGWYNYSPDSATFETVENDVQIIPHGTAFGSQVILNYDLAKEIRGEYRVSFVLDATEYDSNSEIWISILGAWNEAAGNGFRTGMHFKDNNWMDIASYGFARGINFGFQNVVSYVNSGDGVGVATNETKRLFPSLSNKVNIDFELRYDETESIVGYLLLNDVLVQKVDYTALYGESFTFTEVEAVGFDIYCPIKYDIILSNVTIENIGENDPIPVTPVYLAGWQNYKDGAAVITNPGNGNISIVPSGSAFGSTLTLTSELLEGIEGEYEITFDLDLKLTTGTEMWISLIGAYLDDNNLMRSGLHFFANNWNNVAFYGSCQYGNATAEVSQTGFFSVVWPTWEPNAPADSVEYPSLENTIHVKETYTYDANEDIIVTLYINDLYVYSYNLNTYYGTNYQINDCKAVGFDCFISEEGCATITNFKVSKINK